jgi:hypothetical protein
MNYRQLLNELQKLTEEQLSDTLKEYHFTDEQIDQLLRLARNKAFQVKYNPQPEDEGYDYDCLWYKELANQIEDQIVNHPTNP